MTICTGLPNPSGVISRFGVLPNGATVETTIVGPITVPTSQPEEHHITDLHVGVAKGSSLTRFILYYQPVGASQFTVVDEVPIGDYGSAVITLASSHKFKAGEVWKVTVIQGTAGRVSIRVGGQSRWQDSRD